MKQTNQSQQQAFDEKALPENAFRELQPGEEYEPLMKPSRTYKEVTPWSLVWGILMAIIFSAATAYLGLKVGQVFEAAIPITIIAVGVAGATHRKDPLGENVIIQSIGACSGMIVSGAIFTLPALYIHRPSILKSRSTSSKFSSLRCWAASSAFCSSSRSASIS